MTKAENRIAQIYHLRAQGSPTRGPENPPPSPDVQPSGPAAAPVVWSWSQMVAWVISRVETTVLTPEMRPKIEWAEQEPAGSANLKRDRVQREVE